MVLQITLCSVGIYTIDILRLTFLVSSKKCRIDYFRRNFDLHSFSLSSGESAILSSLTEF